MISIHAPRGGSDKNQYQKDDGSRYFNPRSPWGERPEYTSYMAAINYFNPRSPWGERRWMSRWQQGPSYFNPRSPWGERPEPFFVRRICFPISIHAPRGGSDVKSINLGVKNFNFNPRSPWGERPRRNLARNASKKFQSTLPVGGATAKMHSFTCGSLAKMYSFRAISLEILGGSSVGSHENPSFVPKGSCEPPGNFWALGLRMRRKRHGLHQRIRVSSGR